MIYIIVNKRCFVLIRQNIFFCYHMFS